MTGLRATQRGGLCDVYRYKNRKYRLAADINFVVWCRFLLVEGEVKIGISLAVFGVKMDRKIVNDIMDKLFWVRIIPYYFPDSFLTSMLLILEYNYCIYLCLVLCFYYPFFSCQYYPALFIWRLDKVSLCLFSTYCAWILACLRRDTSCNDNLQWWYTGIVSSSRKFIPWFCDRKA